MTIADKKTILITGASSGIGAALALCYAKGGAKLYLTGRNRERLDHVAERAKAAGASLIETAAIDVCDRDVMHHWITTADHAHKIDIVIANAGISGGKGGKAYEDPDQVRLILKTNIDGVLNTVDPLLPRFTARKQGQIGIVSSLASFSGWPGAYSYSAGKAAVRIYGEGLRIALAKHGIGVSVICPGFVATPLTAVNPYKMPFIMDAAKAAEIVASGLEKNKPRIGFPWPSNFASWLIGALPACVQERLLRNMPEKPSL